MAAVTVTLPDDLAEFASYAVRAGFHASLDELVGYALRVVRAQTPTPPDVVPLTSAGFDESTFLAGLVDKLARK